MLQSALLATKFFVPEPRRGHVPRSRLTQRLSRAIDYKLTLVSASAGFGKTTLVADWVLQNRDKIPTVWVSLDSRDDDNHRFWEYVVHAIRTVYPAAGETALAMLHSLEPYPGESVITSLINDFATVAVDSILVLDDYQFIKDNAIHSGMVFLLAHLPPKMHVIVATRIDPPFPLAQMRGSGDLLEIGIEDLRFIVEEAEALLRQGKGSELNPEDIDALNKHTEGWAVGLKMAALAMSHKQDIRGFVADFTGSHRYIMDYLVQEVLDQQPREAYEFLLKTSMLDSITAGLCDHLLGGSDGRNMIAKLERENLFLVPLDDSRRWYRYHQLFAELLRHRLDVTASPDEVTHLHQRASEWYEMNILPDEAIHHALLAQDWQRAMRLMYDPDEQRIKRGEFSTLLGWLKALPESALRTHHELYRQYAYVLINVSRELEAGQMVLENLGREASDDLNLQGEITVLKAAIHRARDDYVRSIELLSAALPMLDNSNLRARGTASFLLGLHHWEQGKFAEAERLLIEGHEASSRAGYKDTAAGCLNFLATIVSYRGELKRASNMLREAIQLTDASPASGRPRLSLSQLLYEWNDLEAAAHHQNLVISFGLAERSISGLAQGYFFLAHTRLAQGNIADAKDAMAKADDIVERPGVARFTLARHAAFRALFSIWQQQDSESRKWGIRVLEYADAMPPFLWHVPGRVLIALGKKAEAGERLTRARTRSLNDRLERLLVKISVCQALAAETEDEALAFLAEALIKGEPEGHIRTFVDEGKMLKPLLHKALAKGVTPQHTARLLGIIQTEEGQTRSRLAAVPTLHPPGLLSERELEILHLIEAGLSNRQIAERLVITVATTKTHIHNLSRKLNANTRTQVLARARELKLL